MGVFLLVLSLSVLGFLIVRRRHRRQIYAGDGQMLDREHGRDRWDRKMARMEDKMERLRARMDGVRTRGGDWFAPASSGNHAFDDYRAETLKRLEEEQSEFKEFLGRLRFAKDRAEFDQFIAARRQRPFEPDSQSEPPPAAPHG